jgi:hypothetical protein
MSTTEKTIPTNAPVAASPKPATKTPARSAKPAVAAKPVAAPKVKPTTKPAVKAAVKPVIKPAQKAAPTKPAKIKKPKMVRDSFTFPKAEYEVLNTLKLRAAKLGKPAKKTEVLRAGLKAIASMTDAALLAALQAVPSLKTGRPANAKKAG